MNEMEELKESARKAREELAKEKSGAVWLAMLDCADYVNFSAIARDYYNRSANWLHQRLHGYEVNGKPAQFKPEEVDTFARALRDISAKLATAADTIDAASADAEN
jgi:hypothetical protein